MLKFVADENFHDDVIRALPHREPGLDLVRVQDVGLARADDPTILEWAAQEGRIVLTHDVTTMTRYAYDRVRTGQPMPGVFEVPRRRRFQQVVDEILILAGCSLPGEWEGQVRYLPLS